MRYCYRLLLMMMLFAGFHSSGIAQQIIFQESFEGNFFPPTGWAIINDGAGSNWTGFSSTTFAYDGNRSMAATTSGANAVNAWAITPAINLNTNPVYITFYVRARSNVASERLRFTVGSGAGTANQSTLLADSSNINYATYRKWETTFTPGSPGIYYFGFNALSPSFSNGLHVDSVTIRQEFLPCAGTPNGGAATTTLANVCNDNTVFSLAVTNSTAGQSNLTYQWQQSSNNSTWANISGATNATLTNQTISATTWFRRQITCTSGGGTTANSSSVQVNFSGPVFAALPVNESFENGWQNSCAVRDRPGPNWRNGLATGNASWRRNDDGAAGGWTGATFGAYTPEASDGSTSARFHSAQAFNQVGALILHVDASGTTTKRLQFDYINPQNFTQTDSLRVWISTDGGLTLSRVGNVMTTANTWTTQTIDLNINSATTIIYFESYATTQTGGSDIGLDNVRLSVLTNCSGTPSPGSITLTTVGCGNNQTFNFSVTGATTGQSGLSVQWQQSADSATWTNIAGATNLTYTLLNPSAPVYIRRVITCGTNSANTAGVRVNPGGVSYATLPFLEDFENIWLNACSTRDIPTSFWTNVPASGNTSWRRNDDGVAGGWTSNGGFVNPAAASGIYSARFHSYDAYAINGVGELSLYVNASGTGQKRLRFFHRNLDGTDTLGVAFSTDNGQTWNRINSTPLLASSLGWVQQEYFFNVDNATTIIRFSARGDWGNSDIGIDKVELLNLTPCSGAPPAGTAAFITNPCSNLPIRIGVAGSLQQVNVTYQWQQSADSTNWTNITGATNDSLWLASATSGNFFRRINRCGTSDSSFSSGVKISNNLITFATLPLLESFESWQTGCANNDRPGASWRNDPIAGNNSWRRNDQGTTALWSFQAFGAYIPTATLGSFSARFHSVASFGQQGVLNLYVDGSTGGADKYLTFSHINNSGSDSLNVFISTNGGTAFNKVLGPILSSNTGWRTQRAVFNTNSAQIIVRFVAYGDGGSDDIGLDSVALTAPPPCTGTPASPTIAGPTQVCAGFNFTLSGSGFPAEGTVGNKFYQWQASTNNGTTWVNLINANNPVTVNVVQIIPTSYRLLDSCTASGQKAFSNVLFISGRPDTASYFPLTSAGYAQSFESWQTRCVATEIPDTFWLQRTLLGDSAWRRNDQGASAGWNNVFSGQFTPASATGSFSARFHSKNGGFQRYRGRMDFYVNAGTAPQLEIGFRYMNALDNDSLNVLVSTNGGQSFFRIGNLGSNPFGSFFTPRRFFFSNPGSRVIVRLEGVSATFDDGGSDIGIDSFYVMPRECPVPTGLAYNRAASTASWQSVNTSNFTNYRWELRTSGTAGSGTAGLHSTGTTNGNAVTFSALPQAAYTFFLRSDCTADSSVWNSVSFINRLNDDCGQPRQLTVGAFAGPLNALTDSTNVSSGTNFGCNFSGVTVSDIFFRFTTPANVNQVRLRVNNRQLIGVGNNSTLSYQVYTQSGNCPLANSFVNCNTQDSVDLSVLPSTSYLVRVFAEPVGPVALYRDYRFDISVSQPPPPPPCTQNVNPAPNATGVPVDNVVLRWRRAVGADGYDVYMSPANSTNYNYFGWTNNGNDTSLAINTSLQNSSVYRFYVVPFNSQGDAVGCQTTNFSSFTTAAGVPPPGNDECNTLAAYTVLVSPVIYDTTGMPTFTTTGATQSNNSSLCYGGNDDDVWFTFVATTASHLVRVVRVGNITTDLSITGYAGSCAALQFSNCVSNGNLVMSNLTVGTRYTLRVYTPFTSTQRIAAFKMVVTPMPTPPANNECLNAITLTGQAPQSGTTLGATGSSQGGVSCGSTFASPLDDIWYRFVPQVSGAATVVLNNTGPAEFDPFMAVYSGANCNLLSFVNCVNATGQGGNETLNLTGLVAGNVYYLRVFSNPNVFLTGGNFTLVYNGSTLPVQLGEFSGTAQPASNLLQWTTASEANNKGFGIELSLDGGRNFRSLGFVETKAGSGGNSNQPLRYQFSHDWSAQGLSAQRMWYRLVQTDLNGRTTYSKVVELAPKADGKQLLISTVYPNPAKDQVQVKLEGNTQQVRGATFVITDMAGRVVLSQPLAQGAVQQTLQVSKLAAGQYLIRLHCADGCTSPAVSLRKD